VLELVDGESLDKKIGRGPIPVDEALGIAKQIAEALEAAHEKGIIHRDLKPANIALTRDGQVKVLDFGLAKAVETTSGASGDAMDSPTITSPALMTGVGVILGTAAYMSPEQAIGKLVDKRTDVWSFGLVLWESLTGSRLFQGETVTDTLAGVLRGAIDFGRLPRETPAPVAVLLRRCLDRDPKNRLRDIGEARVALNDPAAASPGNADESHAPRRFWPWIAVCVATALVLGSLNLRPPAEEPRVLKLQILAPDKSTFTSTAAIPAISPDGLHLAFVASSDGKNQLWIRNLDSVPTENPVQLVAMELTGLCS
jgi:serine/threonine-protein kinase